MGAHASNKHGFVLPLQIVLAISGLMLLAFFPPSAGRMLIIPLGHADRIAALNLVLARGALLIGSGPLPGSFVVEATRARIATPLAEAGILLIAAPPAGCGRELPA